MYTGLSRDHTRRKGKILRNHLVHPFILQMWKLRPRGGLTCPRSHSPSGAALQLDSTLAAPGPQRPMAPAAPGSARPKGSLENRGGRAHGPGSLPPLGRLGAWAPAQGGARPGPRRPPPTRPPVADRTTGSHTPCRGRGLGRPRRRPAAAAPRGAGYARPEAAGVTSGGR